MGEMLGYIFGTLDRHNRSIAAMNNRIAKLERTNKFYGKLVIVGLTVYALQEMHLQDLEKRADDYQKRIKALEMIRETEE